MNSAFGYVRVATIVPELTVGGVRSNVGSLVAGASQAAAAGSDLVVFPELSITGYSCADLFMQQTLLVAAVDGLLEFARQTAALPCLFFVGLPVRRPSGLFNCAVAIQGGRLLGAVPKSYLPNNGEFYEKRWFASGLGMAGETVELGGQSVPLGSDLLFAAAGCPELTVGVEICEDLWAPTPPSSELALAGATVLVNLSASNDLVGKTAYRRELVVQQSGRCQAAYVYCSAGPGESTTDIVYGGHQLVAENGRLLAEERRFAFASDLLVVDVDVQFLEHERRRNGSFADAAQASRSGLGRRQFRTILFAAATTDAPATLRRALAPLPFVPTEPSRRHEVCEEIFAIQSTGLAKRLRHANCRRAVIGVSGGLDSTLALLVVAAAFDKLAWPRAGILAITMPGFGTSKRTIGNVGQLCEHMGVPLETIPIVDSCRRHLDQIGHDGRTHDITFENAQARQRTQILMDKANLVGGLVIGTGDLSEMALGWCTYNGDHMSMYAVNCGVPKTLVAFLVEYVADSWAQADLSTTLRDVLATPISPELLPPDEQGRIAQKTEEVVGPYELHDFFLYQIVRCGFSPRKTVWLAEQAFEGTRSADEIRRWLELFLRRFFANQFKRSCLPDGPKVGTIALSPRGDWRMPSDATPAAWLAELDCSADDLCGRTHA